MLRPLAATLAVALSPTFGCEPGEKEWKAFAFGKRVADDFSVEVRVYDGQHALVGVRVAGPGMPAYGGGFAWSSVDGGIWVGTVPLGASHPPPPLSYDLELWDGSKERHQGVQAACFVEDVPTPVAPAPYASVTSPVTFEWSVGTATGVKYAIRFEQPGGGPVPVGPTPQVVAATSLTYPMPQGTYAWYIDSEVGDLACTARTPGGVFSVQ